MFYFNLIKYYFAFKTRLKILDQKLLNFAECIAEKGKFCGRKLHKKLRGQPNALDLDLTMPRPRSTFESRSCSGVSPTERFLKKKLVIFFEGMLKSIKN